MKKVLFTVFTLALMGVMASCDGPEKRAKEMAKKACNCYAAPSETCANDLIVTGAKFDQDYPDVEDQMKFLTTYQTEVRKQCPLYANQILNALQ